MFIFETQQSLETKNGLMGHAYEIHCSKTLSL